MKIDGAMRPSPPLPACLPHPPPYNPPTHYPPLAAFSLLCTRLPSDSSAPRALFSLARAWPYSVWATDSWSCGWVGGWGPKE